MRKSLSILVVAGVLPWGAAHAQDEWEANAGDCQRVLERAKLKQLKQLAKCIETWEMYRDVSALRPPEKRAVAKGFSLVFYKGNSSDSAVAKSALGRMGMRPLPKEDVLPREAARRTRPAETPKYYEEVSAKRQRTARKLTDKGLKYHKKKTRKAIGYYEKAMRADPNFLKAFYNAACAYGVVRDVQAATEVLKEIRSRHTRQSRNLLMLARKDRDFRKMRRHPSFKEVTGYAEIVLLNGAGAEGTPHVKRLKRTLSENHRKPAFVGTDEAPRGRPIVWHKPGMEEVAEELRDLVDPDKTKLKTIDFNTAIDKYDFDVYVVWGMPHKSRLMELPEVAKRRGGGGSGDDGAVDPLKAAKEAKGAVDDAAGLMKAPELPELP